jgi:Zn-dependent protease with chaperone function
MNEEQFMQLIQKHEQYANRKPQGYRNKVLAWIFLGYAVFGGALILSLGLLAFSIFTFIEKGFSFGALKLLLMTLPLSYILLRALKVKKYQPKGIVLSPEDAPQLFRTLDELTTKMKAPRFDTVILDDKWNASVVSISKSMLLGSRRHVLHIGLPMLIGLDDQQVKAVLAHEISHISGKDTTLGAWVYRLDQQWKGLVHYFEQDEEEWLQALFRKFIQWYYPRFYALTFVMRRQQEYIADANAAKATSAQVMAECLVMNHTGGRYFYREFLPAVLEEAEQNNEEPQPLTRLYELMANMDEKREKFEEYMQKALAEKTGYSDSHPSLTDRLNALRCQPMLPNLRNQAVDVYLKNGAEWVSKVEEFLNLMEVTGELTNFEEAYAYAKQVKQQLKEEEEKELARYQELMNKPSKTLDELYQFAELAFRIDGPLAGVKVLRQIISTYKNPADTAPAFFKLGKIQLAIDEVEQGVQLLEVAAHNDYRLRWEVYDCLRDFFAERGDEKKATKYERKLERWEELLSLSDEECEEDFDGEEELLPHGLSSETLEKIREDLESVPQIGAVYIARRDMSYIPQRACYFIAVEPLTPLNDEESEALSDQIDEMLEHWIGDDYYHLYVLEEQDLLEPFIEAPHACVYRAKAYQK